MPASDAKHNGVSARSLISAALTHSARHLRGFGEIQVAAEVASTEYGFTKECEGIIVLQLRCFAFKLCLLDLIR